MIKFFLNGVKVTYNDGKIVLNNLDLNGKYLITAHHDDSYYTGIETIKTNIDLQPGEYIITSSYNGVNISNKVTVTA